MKKEEIFENRREISKKICEQIRKNNGQMINAKNFSERPYYEGAKRYKFSTANYLRLLSSENIYNDSRWYKISDIKNNNWTLKENAKYEMLEEWQENTSGEREGFLTEFYNASEIVELERYSQENETLEKVLEYLEERGLLEMDRDVISFKDGINAVKKYSENLVSDELVTILTMQMWIAESKLKIKWKTFLPVYSEEILQEIEKTPDRIFEAINKAQAILKRLRREKIIPIAEEVAEDELFQGLKIIYHGSEIELTNKDGCIYPPESILKNGAAYEFLFMLKLAAKSSVENFKTWLEFSYRNYNHGKILISSQSDEILTSESVAEFLKKRLNKNRRELLENPTEVKKYESAGKIIDNEEILNMITLESKNFESIMNEFEEEEMQYLGNHLELVEIQTI